MYDIYNHFGDMPEVPDMEGMTPEEQEELATHTLLWGCVSYGVAILLGLMLCWVFSGCKGLEKVVTVEKTRTDTLLLYSNIRDSVLVKDSVYVRDGGDTVVVERWHTRWRERVVKDTVYKSKTDSVPMPYPVVKMVERERSLKEKVLIGTGVVAWIFIVCMVSYRLKRIFL
jgi:hypothetical protein